MSESSLVPAKVTYPVHTYRLDNGLRVVVSPDTTAPVVAINLWYDVGSRDEHPHQTGLAHLFEHLMFEGSAHTTKGEHLHVLQSVGGRVNATTWFDRTTYFETIPVSAVELALWLEADRLGSVGDHLTSQTLDNQRDVVKSERRQRYDNAPYGDILEHIVATVFPDTHPYGHTTIGSMKDLDAVTVDQARDFFHTHYGPDTAVLSLVGDITPAQGKELAQKYFGELSPIKRPPRQPRDLLPPLQHPEPTDVVGQVPADAVYAVWRLPAHNTTELDAIRYALAALGDGQNSRMYRRMVTSHPIAASVGTSIFELIDGNSIGIAYAIGLPGIDANQLSEELLTQIGTLHEGISAEEQHRIFVSEEREWLFELATVDQRAYRLSEYTSLHGNPEMVNCRLDQLSDITIPLIAEVASVWLSSESAAVIKYRRRNA